MAYTHNDYIKISQLIDTISAWFGYQTKAKEETIILISHIPDYVKKERLETN
jgi:hypothetical protein